MNISMPVPMECKYQAHLHRLEEDEEIRIGDFWQTWLGNLSRVTEIKEGEKVDLHRPYYRVVSLKMVE